jgi:hypothetical protein
MPTQDKWAPRTSGVRAPTDNKKKNGMFLNWPRNPYFGGVAGAPKQEGTKGFNSNPSKGGNAVGPISDRG